MASQEQIDLSDFIKNVHKKLREDSKVLGSHRAWVKHCNDAETLKQYASSMETLSSKYWEGNEEKDEKVISRLNWIYENCRLYFKGGGLQYQRERESDIAKRNTLNVGESFDLETLDKYELLDVGSCYNPLKKFELFNVIPIDIAPANTEVFQCDFLNLKVIYDSAEPSNKIMELQQSTFHIVVFCLLLEYLPAPEQRFESCEKAYKLLVSEGLLIIITPDSKHVGANAKIMKSWRYVLAKLGFCRIKYEKLPYLHCMVFRKNINCEVAKRWATLNDNKGLYDNIVIPQDFNNKNDKVS